jgi:hypothetical protein
MSTRNCTFAIAAYRTGRRLYVVTTNLDAQRTAIWDMGKIARAASQGRSIFP